MNQVRVVIKRAQAYAKAIAAGVGSVLVGISGFSTQLGMDIIPVEAQGWVTLILAGLTAFSTWVIPNFDPDGQ